MNDYNSGRMPKKIKSYEVSKLLGRGGMGEVMLAHHEVLERPVAIKRYAPALTTKHEKQNQERFIREGIALARLSHHCIVGIHDLFEHRGQFCMVLEYVDGCHVGELAEKGPLPLDVACIIGLKVSEALEHAHFHGIIHRDIKSTNVMVSKDGRVKLMDFGIARSVKLERVTQTGMLVGTPMYMAPEVLGGQEANELSDIYGLGALMYHCLTGRRLFFHANQDNLYHHIMAGKYLPLGKVVRGVPRQLKSIVHRCLSKKPEQRFQSAAEFRQTLDIFMASRGMWANHAIRLAGFMYSMERVGTDAATAINEMSVSDSAILSHLTFKPPNRILRGVFLGIASATIGAGLLFVAIKLGWLSSIMDVLSSGSRP